MPPPRPAPAATARARIVALGGLDPTGGAGLVRDHATAAALGVPLVGIATALTRQGLGPPGLAAGDAAASGAFSPRPTAVVLDELHGALASGPQPALKLGMVATAELALALAELLSEPPWAQSPVVFDPVLASSSGLALYAGEVAALAPLCARATLTTPNLTELARLAGHAGPAPVALDQALGLARTLVETGQVRAVLVKGGHLRGDPVDVLVTPQSEARFPHARVPGRDPRGTGCALATAIAAGLARGRALPEACGEAIAWLHARIERSLPRDGGDWLP